MIGAIGQTSVEYWPLRASKDANVDLSLTPLGADTSGDVGAVGLLKRTSEEPVHAGFGEGTVSVPGAAVRTINKNMQGVKRVTAWQAAQARKAARRQAEQVSNGSNALDVVAAMGRAANVAEARLAGEEPASTTTQATLTVNGQTISYLSSARQTSGDTASATRLNILV